MNKIFTLIVFLFVSKVSNSQWGFFTEAGMNRSTLAGGGRLKGGPSRLAAIGFTGSIGISKKLNNSFQLTNKLSFFTKNFHESFFVSPDDHGTNDYKLSAFQLHVLVEKNISPKRKVQVYPTAGLYSTIHTTGKINYQHYSFGPTISGSRKIKFGKDNDLSKWDAGLSVGAKVQWRNYFLHFLSDFGLVKPYSTRKTKWHSVHFTLGYFFKK